MKWVMALLAFLALTEASLAVCPAAHAHAMADSAQTALDGHHHGAMSSEALQSETPECHGTSELAPVETEVCTECSGGMSCGECALLTAAETPSFDAAAPPLADRHKASLGVVAPVRPLAFDPPPPKA